MAARISYLAAEDPEVDLQVAEAMTAVLEEYLVRDELYRTLMLPGGEQNLQMTLGSLLTRLHRLTSVQATLPEPLQARIASVDQEARATIYSLRTRAHERLRREVKARLDSLRWYLDDCPGDHPRCRAEYPFEIRNRQRIEEIRKELETLPADLQERLNAIDSSIRSMARTTGFVWDEQLQVTYPPQPYWYLYLRP